jgi:hypothetical protein
MDWPHHSVEDEALGDFIPPHCPNAECDFHTITQKGAFPWSDHGSYIRPSDRREIPRYRCRSCGRTFSQQTFSCTYWLKRRELLPRIGAQLVAGSCLRQIGRTVECAPSTAERHVGRRGRHAIGLMTMLLVTLREEGGLGGRFCYDHFETFAIEQLTPLAIGTLVHAGTLLLVSIDGAQHARGGTKTPRQKQRWAEILRTSSPPPRGAYTLATQDMLTRLTAITHGPITLDTDDHKAYAVALKRCPERGRIEHRAFRNPTERERAENPLFAQERDAALWPVDRLHSLWRHSHAHDRRETIAFARRHNAALERAFLIAAWRNWIKRRDEQDVHAPTPAVEAGLDKKPWTWRRLIAQRLFPGRLPIPESWMDIYRRAITWPNVDNWTKHALKYAF